MKGTTSLTLLVLAAIATPALAVWSGQDQDPQQADWQQHIDKACNARRFALRIAAAKKVANGGDAAVPAIRAYVKKHSLNKLPTSLVDAIADSKTAGAATTELLREWANVADFYWRSSAMRGLALRGLDKATFEPFVDDPAWLMRTHARLGLALAGDEGVINREESDPRARVRLTRMLVERGQTPPLQPLFDALADQRTFLGDPWGPRLGQEANRVLRQWLAKDYPADLVGSDDKQAFILALAKAAQAKSQQVLQLSPPKTDPEDAIVGGIEILSCKFGDQFVQWTADGTLRFGVDGSRTAKLPADAWQQLSQERTAIALEQSVGEVICDKMRVRLFEPDVHVAVAPAALPEPAAAWLNRLANELEEADEQDLAADLRRGIGQFDGR